MECSITANGSRLCAVPMLKLAQKLIKSNKDEILRNF